MHKVAFVMLVVPIVPSTHTAQVEIVVTTHIIVSANQVRCKETEIFIHLALVAQVNHGSLNFQIHHQNMP